MTAPHDGNDMILPQGIIARCLTSTNDQEIRACLDTLRKTHAGTGFIHESFHKDDPKRFTRSLGRTAFLASWY
jgi:meiotically up-regulated gene 157 (Mug157) protein